MQDADVHPCPFRSGGHFQNGIGYGLIGPGIKSRIALQKLQHTLYLKLEITE
jgi:hypothetical protein